MVEGRRLFRRRILLSIFDIAYASRQQGRPPDEVSSLEVKAFAGYSPKCQKRSWLCTERFSTESSFFYFGSSMMLLTCTIELSGQLAFSFEKPRCRPASQIPCFWQNVSKMTEGWRFSDDGPVVHLLMLRTHNKTSRATARRSFVAPSARRSPDILQNMENRSW